MIISRLLFVLIALLPLISTAQVKSQITTAKIDEIMSGMRNTTYVVLMDPEQTEMTVEYEMIVSDTVVQKGGKNDVVIDDNPYNHAIKEAMKLWRIGKYEFISLAEFEEKRLDPNSSFIFPIKVKEEFYKERVESLYLVYAVGNKRGTRAERLPRIAAVPVTYYNVGAEYYTWKMAGLIQFLQGHADYVAGLSGTTDEEIIKEYSGRAKRVNDYTLYVTQEDLTAKTWDEEKISAMYGGEVKIVSAAELKNLIMKKTPEAVFLHKSGPERTKTEAAVCRKFIISMEDGECLFVSEDEIKKNAPEGLLEGDFKKMKR